MTEMEIEVVDSWGRRREFLNLPWTIYRNDPHWMPMLRGTQKELLNYSRNPYYAEAEIGTFLARRKGRVVGRIAAIVNRAHNRKYGEKLGFFGFFECEDDPTAADALFDTARVWLRARGMTVIRGPMNPSLNHETALLIDGFDSSPMFMMTHNPPYYAGLIERQGFVKSQDLYAFRAPLDRLAGLEKDLRLVGESCQKRMNMTIRPMDRTRFGAEVELFLRLFNEAYEGTWGFVPISDAETRHMASGLKQLIVPEMTAIGEVDGEPIGAIFALPDYNSRIKAIGGRLFPFGFIRLLWNRQSIKRVRVVSANVVQKYQRRGAGLALLLPLLPILKNCGVEEVEFSWVMESQPLSNQSLRRAGLTPTKTYRIYDAPIEVGFREAIPAPGKLPSPAEAIPATD
jgi:hypothetical protein